MCLPINNEMFQNKPLRNGLLIAGISLTIVGIALSCIPHTVGVMTGQVCLTIGVPILAMGVILAIYQKANEAPRSEGAEPSESCFRTWLNRGSGRSVGSNQSLTEEEIRNQRLTVLGNNPAQPQNQNGNPNQVEGLNN